MLKYSFLLLLFFLESTFVNAQNPINSYDHNGKKTGVWMKKYPNGNIRYSGQFLNDKEVGVFKFYSEFYSNQPYIIKKYKKNSNVCQVQFFTKTGVLESQGAMLGKNRVGKWLYYDVDGKSVVLEENYFQGKLSGVTNVYYKDGSLTEVRHYKNGILHGESLRYTDQGKLIAKIPYQNGKIHGKVFYYENTGVIRETGFYDQGKRVGRWEFYIDGALAGYEEPNKKIERAPVSLEEIQKRKAAKNPKKEIPKKIYTLEELEKRKAARNK